MGEPALIFSAELVRPVNATHAKNYRRQPERSRVVQYVLICRAFGAAVWTVEIEPLIFADAASTNGGINGLVAVAVQTKIDVFQAAVDLVRGRKNDRRRIPQFAHGFEEIQRSTSINIEIIDWCIEAARNSHLCGKMKYGRGLLHAFRQCSSIARVGDLKLNQIAMFVSQPFRVSFYTRA